VGRVPDAAVRRPEVAAAGPRQVADAHPRCAGVSRGVGIDHREQRPDQPRGAESPPPPVGGAAQHRIPGEEVQALGRQHHAPDQPSGVGPADRHRGPPPDPPVLPAGVVRPVAGAHRPLLCRIGPGLAAVPLRRPDAVACRLGRPGHRQQCSRERHDHEPADHIPDYAGGRRLRPALH